jgi:hypothetical protein
LRTAERAPLFPARLAAAVGETSSPPDAMTCMAVALKRRPTRERREKERDKERKRREQRYGNAANC